MPNPAWDGTISFTPTAGPVGIINVTVTFQISLAAVPRGPTVDISDRHVPGSGVGTVAAVNVVDIGGVHATNDVTMTGYFPTPILYFAFETLLGLPGNLIFFDSGDAGLVPAGPHGYTAVLTRCKRRTRGLTTYAGASPPAHFSETHADLSFLITGTF